MVTRSELIRVLVASRRGGQARGAEGRGKEGGMDNVAHAVRLSVRRALNTRGSDAPAAAGSRAGAPPPHTV